MSDHHKTGAPAARSLSSNGGMITLQPGAQPLPDYQLIRKLGEGGFGEVWHARGPGGIEVALKFIRLDKRGGAMEERSLEAMKSIRHPNLVSVFGAWHRDNLLILAMELCDRSLSDRLKETLAQEQPGIPLKELLNYMRDAANGLDALNEQDVQHRDVKPANLLLLNKGVKVADFGLAKMLESTVASHTGPCTPAYTTPESFRGQVAKQSDQYSLAMTYYHLRTGRMLFEGNLMRLLQCHVNEQPALVGLMPAEQEAVAKALAKEPDKRWRSCKTFVNELIKAYQAAQGKWAVAPTAETLAEQERGAKTSSGPRALRPQPTEERASASEPQEPVPLNRTSSRKRRRRSFADKSRAGLWIGIGVAVTIMFLLGLGGAIALSAVLANRFRGNAMQEAPTSPPIAAGPTTTMPPPGDGPKTPEPAPADGSKTPTPGPADHPKTTEPVGAQTPALLKAPFMESEAKEAQVAWAKHLGRQIEEEIDLGGGVKMSLVLIPPGTFEMGSPKDEKGREQGHGDFYEEKQHTVTITKPFYLGKFVVAQAQYQAIAKKNPSFHSPYGEGKNRVKGMDTRVFPVEEVSWDEASAYCEAVGKAVRWGKVCLPTEAQWEYACRAGTATAYYFGDDAKMLGLYAWYWSNAKNITQVHITHPVGGKKPNAFGLYDMLGNVWQLCADYYGPYDGLSNENPERMDRSFPGTLNARVSRGSCITNNDCRAAARNRGVPGLHANDVGFRVCIRLD